MPDFLLELRSEEIPARMQAGARADLERSFRKQLAEAGVAAGEVTVWSTPRRLVLIARDLPQATEPVREELKGPRTTAPAQALEGFLRKTGLRQDQLTARGDVWFAVTEKPGRASREVLAEAIPAIVRAFPWPKSMRWGAASRSTESVRWVRPLSGIVAILGENLVECEVAGLRSGFATLGHRFHHPGEITIGGAHDYAAKLAACHVIVDQQDREALIRERARTIAAAAGLTLVEDEGLVVENAGLTEWPVPLLGEFDPAYLEVPPEVIQLTARSNQKYFVCERDGKLANAFVCTANIEAADGGAAIIAGNRKVLAARLADARFFWEQDRRKTLAQHAEGLSRITFHEKLGTLADKAERVAKLAEWLATEGIVPGCDPALASQAALLCKADLVTAMVGEFPELQGVIGGYYARAEGLPAEVADAIRDHYKPVGQDDEVPTAPVTVAVALADKLDTLASFFLVGEIPTGSKDPLALRRAALGALNLSIQTGVYVKNDWIFENIARSMLQGNINYARSHSPKLDEALTLFWPDFPEGISDCFIDGKLNLSNFFRKREIKDESIIVILSSDDIIPSILSWKLDYLDKVYLASHELTRFFVDRLKVQQREAGVRHDLIDAVFALGAEDDLVRLLARVHVLQAFIGTEDGANLLVAYKRAANILKKEGFDAAADLVTPAEAGAHLETSEPYATREMPSRVSANDEGQDDREGSLYPPEPAEQALIAALEAAAPRAAAAVEAEDFAGAMAALASLRAPIDLFFDQVTVNDPDPVKRRQRLRLLDRFRAAVHNVADFSRIEG